MRSKYQMYIRPREEEISAVLAFFPEPERSGVVALWQAVDIGLRKPTRRIALGLLHHRGDALAQVVDDLLTVGRGRERVDVPADVDSGIVEVAIRVGERRNQPKQSERAQTRAARAAAICRHHVPPLNLRKRSSELFCKCHARSAQTHESGA